MRQFRRRLLLHLATDLSALVENPADLPHGFVLLTRSYRTPAADAARAALRADPRLAPLLKERYWGAWPDAAELRAMPLGSLGQAYACWLAAAGGQPLPDPVLVVGSDGDDHWLHQRVRHTHDLWHVVCGCPPSPAGEAALSAINVMQLRWPGSAMLLGADLMHRCLEGPLPSEPYRADPVHADRATAEPDVGLAVAYGLELGAVCAPLVAQRWEEGWESLQSSPAHRSRLALPPIDLAGQEQNGSRTGSRQTASRWRSSAIRSPLIQAWRKASPTTSPPRMPQSPAPPGVTT